MAFANVEHVVAQAEKRGAFGAAHGQYSKADQPHGLDRQDQLA